MCEDMPFGLQLTLAMRIWAQYLVSLNIRDGMAWNAEDHDTDGSHPSRLCVSQRLSPLSAAPEAAQMDRPLVILDFDGTLTALDTLKLIAPSEDALKPYSDAFMADYATVDGDPTSFEQFERRMQALRVVCQRSNERCQELLRGMRIQDMLRRAERAELAPGLSELVAALDRFDTLVISVNWSATFVRAVLARAGLDAPVIANELEVGKGDGLCTGKIVGELFNGLDKASVLPREPLLAIGDAEDDIPILRRAKYGLVVKGSARAACERLGISVVDFDAQWDPAAHPEDQLISIRDLRQAAQVLKSVGQSLLPAGSSA